MEQILKKPVIRSILALLCCALWGSAFPCVKIGYEWFRITEANSKIVFAGYRFLLAGLLTLLIGSVLEKGLLTVKREHRIKVAGIGLFQTGLQYLFFYIGIGFTTGVKGTVINASNAFISLIAAHFILKQEKMTWSKLAGCMIGVAGVIVVNLSPGAWGGGFTLKGEGMILAATIIYGISSVFTKKISDIASPMAITAYQLICGGGMLLLTGILAGGRVPIPSGRALFLLIYLALLSTIAFSVWTALLRTNPMGSVAIFGFSIPIFGSVLSALLLGENILEWKNLIALLLVSVGIWIVNRGPERKESGLYNTM